MYRMLAAEEKGRAMCTSAGERSAEMKDEGAGRNGDVYEGGGAGLNAKMEDEGAGRNNDVYKAEGAGLSAKKKDEGTGGTRWSGKKKGEAGGQQGG